MRIADLEFFLLDPFHGSANSSERTLLVRLSTAEGPAGWGEARCGWRPSELLARREGLLPLLAGRNVFDVEELLEVDALHPTGLRAAIEMACWDLIARAARQPLCRLWGGEYRPRVPLAIQLPLCEPERAAQLSRDLVARGFPTQTVVATGELELDLAIVAAVREAVGDRVKLRLDGGSHFALDAARELCRRLEYAGLQYLQDPLNTGREHFASLARQTAVPLAISSGIRSPEDVLAVARGGTAPHVVIDLGYVGGIWPAHKCAIVAQCARLPVSLSGGMGLGVAFAALLQLAAATPNLALEQPCTAYQLHEDILQQRPQRTDGMIVVPQAPGLGVEVDRARIEAYQVT